VLRHSFEAEKMGRLLRELFQEAVVRNYDFIAQTELNEIKYAVSNGDEGVENFRNFENFFRGIAGEEALKAWLRSHVLAFWDVREWLAAMSGYDFVLGTRFHGAIAAIENGTPARVICHDTRTTEMCQFLGIPHIGLLELESIKISELYEGADLSLLAHRYAELYPAYREFMEANKVAHRL
jgi:hypothetical protein